MLFFLFVIVSGIFPSSSFLSIFPIIILSIFSISKGSFSTFGINNLSKCNISFGSFSVFGILNSLVFSILFSGFTITGILGRDILNISNFSVFSIKFSGFFVFSIYISSILSFNSNSFLKVLSIFLLISGENEKLSFFIIILFGFFWFLGFSLSFVLLALSSLISSSSIVISLLLLFKAFNVNLSEFSIKFFFPENRGIKFSIYNLSTDWFCKGSFSLGLILKLLISSIIFLGFGILNILNPSLVCISFCLIFPLPSTKILSTNCCFNGSFSLGEINKLTLCSIILFSILFSCIYGISIISTFSITLSTSGDILPSIFIVSNNWYSNGSFSLGCI